MLELRFCSEFGYWHQNLVGCNEPCIIGSSGSIVFRMRIFALYSGGKRMEHNFISEDILEVEFILLFLSWEYGRTSIALVGSME